MIFIYLLGSLYIVHLEKYVSDFQATSCSCRALTGQQQVTMPGWWALTCLQLKAPVWSSGPTDSPHVSKPDATTWSVELMQWYLICVLAVLQPTAGWTCGGSPKVMSNSCWPSETCRSLGNTSAWTSNPFRSTRYHYGIISDTAAAVTDIWPIFTWCGLQCLQIVLEGIRGTAGFIGLDDIQYTVGVDCNKKITDTSPGMMPQCL